jgi:hypothetical protein
MSNVRPQNPAVVLSFEWFALRSETALSLRVSRVRFTLGLQDATMDERLKCPHCATETEYGARVCFACKAEIEYGPSRKQIAWVGLGFLLPSLGGVAQLSKLLGYISPPLGLFLGAILVSLIAAIILARRIWSKRVVFYRSYRHI